MTFEEFDHEFFWMPNSPLFSILTPRFLINMFYAEYFDIRDDRTVPSGGWSNFDRLDPKTGVFLQSTEATPCGHLKWKLTPQKLPCVNHVRGRHGHVSDFDVNN